MLLLCEAAGLDLARFVTTLRGAPGPRANGPLEAWAPLPGRALVAVRVGGAGQGQLQLAFQAALGDEEAPGRFAGQLKGRPTIWTGAGADEGWSDLASVAKTSDVPVAVLEALVAGRTTGEVVTLTLEPPPDAAALEAATRKLEGLLGPSPKACVLHDAADDEGPLAEEEEAPAVETERAPTPTEEAARAAAAASSGALLKLFGGLMAVVVVLALVFVAMARQRADKEAALRREWEQAGTDVPFETWKLNRR